MRGADAPAEGLLVLRDSPVHRLPAHVKLVTLVAFALVVVATPAGSWGTYAALGALLAVVVAAARLPARLVARRTLVEAPFVVFAALLPVVAAGEQVAVGPLSLSRPGLVGAGTLLAKATLGVVAAIVLAATTPPRDLLAGLDRLHLPRSLGAILSFMLRYLAVIAGDLDRMNIARASRGEARRAARLTGVAAGAGALFVRSYERGERVHHAMLARGYTGRLPAVPGAAATPGQWVTAAALPVGAGVVVALSLLPRSG
jgi:cobalt/nickel transport system permease protein